METVKIGSFNIQKFSKNADHERLKKLADIILSSGVDILAIQEVYAKVAIDNLLKYMGMNLFESEQGLEMAKKGAERLDILAEQMSNLPEAIQNRVYEAVLEAVSQAMEKTLVPLIQKGNEQRESQIEQSNRIEKIERQQARINQLELNQALAGVVRYPASMTYTAGYSPFCACGGTTNI